MWGDHTWFDESIDSPLSLVRGIRLVLMPVLRGGEGRLARERFFEGQTEVAGSRWMRRGRSRCCVSGCAGLESR